MKTTCGVFSKAEFFRRSNNLEFGNRLRQWSWYEYLGLRLEELPKLVSVRNCLAGGDTRVQRYRMLPVQATNHCIQLLLSHVVTVEDLLLDESAPDDLVALQAEVRNSERFIDIRYAEYSGVGMRQAYDQMKHVSGARAVAVLREHLDAPSLDNLWDILARFQDSVVELSAYAVPVGVLSLNTIIWEVRNY